jgi:hypothetical protein
MFNFSFFRIFFLIGCTLTDVYEGSVFPFQMTIHGDLWPQNWKSAGVPFVTCFFRRWKQHFFFVYLHPVAVPSLLPVTRPPVFHFILCVFILHGEQNRVSFFVVGLVRKVVLVKHIFLQCYRLLNLSSISEFRVINTTFILQYFYCLTSFASDMKLFGLILTEYFSLLQDKQSNFFFWNIFNSKKN